jgi:hypothetical protein
VPKPTRKPENNQPKVLKKIKVDSFESKILKLAPKICRLLLSYNNEYLFSKTPRSIKNGRVTTPNRKLILHLKSGSREDLNIF